MLPCEDASRRAAAGLHNLLRNDPAGGACRATVNSWHKHLTPAACNDPQNPICSARTASSILCLWPAHIPHTAVRSGSHAGVNRAPSQILVGLQHRQPDHAVDIVLVHSPQVGCNAAHAGCCQSGSMQAYTSSIRHQLLCSMVLGVQLDHPCTRWLPHAQTLKQRPELLLAHVLSTPGDGLRATAVLQSHKPQHRSCPCKLSFMTGGPCNRCLTCH